MPAAIALLTACSASSVGEEPSVQTASQSSAAADCTVDPAVSTTQAEAAASLRRTIEAGPLYGAAVRDTSRASCRIASDSEAITLEYAFRDGGSMRVRRDARIEYTSQELHLIRPPADMPVSILMRAEQAAFADDGCGIDWKQAETAPAPDAPEATETIYRGDVCNCQARVRADKSGRVVGLLLRSAC